MSRVFVRGAQTAMIIGAIGAMPMFASAGSLQNGGFESGNFSGWSGSGFTNLYNGNGAPQNSAPSSGGPNYSTFATAEQLNGGGYTTTPTATNNQVVQSQTTAFDGNGPASSTPVGPFGGKYLAFIANETAAGDNSLTGSSISQTFTVPIGATTLSAAIQLLNNDTGGATVRTYNDDFGGIALLNSSGSVIGSDQYNVDIAGLTGSQLNANAGGFYNASGWQTPSFNIAGLGGQNVTFVAYVINYGGDAFTESRLLVDNVTVPEPASLALLGVGAAGLLIRRKSR